MGQFRDLVEGSVKDYVDNVLSKGLKKAGIECKVKKEVGYTKYSCGEYDIVNDGVGISVKKDGKEVRYFSKPKLQYKDAIEMIS